jgi:hypothetical protein
MKLETVDDILRYYGGDKEGKRDESKLSKDVPGTAQNLKAKRNTGQDETGLSGISRP